MTFFCRFRDLSITALNKSLFGDISFISVSKCRYDSDLLFASNFFNDGVLGKNFDACNFRGGEIKFCPTSNPLLNNVIVVGIRFCDLTPFMRNCTCCFQQ